MRLSRRQKLIWAVAVLVMGGYLATKFGPLSGAASPEFKDARYQGAIISQDIVNLSNSLSAQLEEVNKYDKDYDYTKALALTAELMQKNNAIKARAIELSGQLEKMTGALADIKSDEARRAAMESVSNRLALISRLLSYSNYLSNLLNTLRDRFSGIATDQKVAAIITNINAEITAINSFNREAGQAMDRFDEIMKNK